ncbi:PREDICTED: transient receptor potential cation channel subfamily M member 2-like [Priapulus caudatus]|uniref:Transient receptor potential cation channel subfamily M member 2-like n=1 Tax=Priapulus caudatus TaxID=37621 RepID=A0ABM1E2C9_PRICU|nr:PREDICTED: transient receptor potential cation channel subfamily M member 2-like [Priapulus caudatus]
MHQASGMQQESEMQQTSARKQGSRLLNGLRVNRVTPARSSSDFQKGEMFWVRHNINKRICTNFLPEARHEDICKCGYDKEDHHHLNCSPSLGVAERWDSTWHTDAEPTDAFGEIEFVGYGQRIGKYVRVDHATKMDTMIDLLKDVWKLSTPNLLISVTGGAKNFSMSPRLKEVFHRSLIKAAQSNGAWIITAGTHAGVMKHVGEAVQDYVLAHGMHAQENVIAIGIAPWGVISSRNDLVDPKGKWPARYRVDIEPSSQEVQLDPNHSHFILVDDGTQHTFGVEIGFRERLVQEIAKQGVDTSSSGSLSVPVVCIVVEGGPGTLENVYTAVLNDTPIVIVEGSGRAADLLVYAYKACKTVTRDEIDEFGARKTEIEPVIDDNLRYELLDKLSHEFGTTHLQKRWNWLRQILKKRHLLSVFKLDSSESAQDIDIAVLNALLRTNESKVTQLRLAIAWNRIDMARNYIFTENTKWKVGELAEIMVNAILDDRVEFVQVMLEQGISLTDVITRKRLKEMYNVVKQHSSLLELLLEVMLGYHGDEDVGLQHIGELIGTLMGDFFTPPYIADNASDALLKNPARELFYWSVFNNRYQMALLFWQNGKNQIAAALTAFKLLTTAVERIPDIADAYSSVADSITNFEELAVGTLTQCYKTNERKTLELLVSETPQFGGATCLALAASSHSFSFMSTVACQDVLNNLWRGGLSGGTSISKNTFMAARVLLALDLVLFFMRLLHIFLVHKELGPKLVMIARMLNDLLYFISIMVVFVIAYGVASMAILFPNTPFSATLVKDILYNAYFQMYGELLLESIEGTDCSSIAAVWQTGVLPRCPELSNVVLCLLALYLLLTNILLFNLLIAMFSYTFEKARNKTDSIWKFHRYWLVMEYFERPPLVPPLICLAHVFLGARAVLHGNRHHLSTPFKKHLSDEDRKSEERFEMIMADVHYRSVIADLNGCDGRRFRDLQDSISLLSNKVMKSQEVNDLQEKVDSLTSAVSILQTQLEKTNVAMAWVVGVLAEKNSKPLPSSFIEETIEGSPRHQMQKNEKSRYEPSTLARKMSLEMDKQEQQKLHVNCRSSPYPGSAELRVSVPDDKVPWEIFCRDESLCI